MLLIDLDLQLALRTIDDKRAVVFIAEALQQLVQVIRNDNILIQHKGIFSVCVSDCKDSTFLRIVQVLVVKSFPNATF